jgi:hypothetical protein
MCLFLCVLFVFLSPPVSAYKQSEIDWVSCGNFSTALLWGSSVNVSCEGENYTLFVRDFSVEGDFVVLDIFHNDTLLTTGFMQVNESFYYNETAVTPLPLKVVLGSISGGYQEEEPTYSIAELQVLTLGMPNFSFSTNTTSSSNCVYNISVTVNNSGTARLKNVVVSYEISDELYVLRTSADHPYHTGFGGRFVKKIPLFGELKVGESVTTWFEVLPPALSARQNYSVKVSIEGYDILGRRHQSNFTYNISVPRNIIATKSITIRRPYASSSYVGTVKVTTVSESDAESEQSVEEKAYPGNISQHFQDNAVPYVGDQLIVRVSLFNTGCNDIEEVRLGEVIPRDLILDPYQEVNWSTSLRSKSSASFNYTLRPLHTGEYVMPSTVLEMVYNGVKYTSTIDMSDVTLTFHGPDIVVRKNVAPAVLPVGGVATVTLSVENRGDRSAHVEAYDRLPTGSSIKTGNMRVEGVLHPVNGSDEPRLLSTVYTFRVSRPGEIRLPAARVEFVDITHYNGTVYSNRPKIVVVENTPTPTPEKTVAATIAATAGRGDVSESASDNGSEGGFLSLPGFEAWRVLVAFAVVYLFYRVK